MNEEQVSSRNKFLKKIGKGEYKLVENKCLCGGERDLIIADKDRYDIPITTVTATATNTFLLFVKINLFIS